MVRSSKQAGAVVWFMLAGTDKKVSWPLEIFSTNYFGGEISARLIRLGMVQPLTPQDRVDMAGAVSELPLFRQVRGAVL